MFSNITKIIRFPILFLSYKIIRFPILKITHVSDLCAKLTTEFPAADIRAIDDYAVIGNNANGHHFLAKRIEDEGWTLRMLNSMDTDKEGFSQEQIIQYLKETTDVRQLPGLATSTNLESARTLMIILGRALKDHRMLTQHNNTATVKLNNGYEIYTEYNQQFDQKGGWRVDTYDPVKLRITPNESMSQNDIIFHVLKANGMRKNSQTDNTDNIEITIDKDNISESGLAKDVTLRWSVPNEDTRGLQNPNELVQAYSIYVGTNPSYQELHKELTSADLLHSYDSEGNDNYSYTLTNLVPNTTYYISLRVINGNQQPSGLSALLKITTEEL